MTVLSLLLALVLWAGLALGAPLADMNVPADRLFAACLSAGLLAIAFGMLALALGCATGRKGTATGVSAGLAVAFYFVNALAPSVDFPSWVRKISPFYYYIGHSPLTNGVNGLHAAVLVALAAVLLLAAYLGFRRRDLSS